MQDLIQDQCNYHPVKKSICVLLTSIRVLSKRVSDLLGK